MKVDEKIEQYLMEATAAGKYPELTKLAKELEKMVVDEINKRAPKIKSDMPYRQQYVLEELIRLLKADV